MIERLFRYQASSDYDCYTVHYTWHKKRRALRELFDLAVAGQRRENLRILDVGCGDGYDLFMLSRAPAGGKCARLVGVDLDGGNVAYGRARAAFEGDRRLEFKACDAVAEPLGAGEPPDIIICSEVVEHLSDPDRLIARLAELLPAGGHLILTTPNGGSWPARLRRALGRVPAPAEAAASGHISVRGRKEWRAACRRAGLRLLAERRGSAVYGAPALDRRRLLAGLCIALDGLCDALRLKNMSWETLQLYRKDRPSGA